jgi:DNA-directed RNA polymerase I and III subunit RPAC1
MLATATYRILPHITIKQPIPPHLADKFQKSFSPGVIRIDPRTRVVSVDQTNVRNDSVSREVLRHPEFTGMVELSRVRDHFLCELLLGSALVVLLVMLVPVSVESEGPYAPERLLLEAIKVMREKLSVMKSAAEALLDQEGMVNTGNAGDVQMADV